MLAYSVTSGQVKDTTSDAKNDVPCSGRPNNREIGRGSVAGYGAEFC